jgi:hypothetical protein
VIKGTQNERTRGVINSGPLDFPCVSVKNMGIWRALT